MRTFVTSLFLSLIALIAASSETSGGQPCGCDSVSKAYWIRQLIDNRFRLNDSSICYPAFPRFALNVYNWGDRTFNSYDTAYVVGTGKNWKLMGKSVNWVETTTMMFPDDVNIDMHTTLYSDAGVRLSFMAVSIGYMWNLNKLLSEPSTRRTFDFQFTTSRFFVNYQSLTSKGGMILTRLGDYNNRKSFRYHFDDVDITSKTAEMVYFFSHRRYSHAAAYSFSKYQLQSAGTGLAGIGFVEQHMKMDFSSLPAEMIEYLPFDNLHYESYYRSYNLTGGYSYNWVLQPRKWLINIYGTASMGYRQVVGRDSRRRSMRSLISNNVQGSLAAVYNHRALFASLNLRLYAYFTYNSAYTHFYSTPSSTVAVGIRF